MIARTSRGVFDMPPDGVTGLPVAVWPTPPKGEHVIRPGLALCSGGDRMTLLRPRALTMCNCPGGGDPRA